jgi:hypothetical protein
MLGKPLRNCDTQPLSLFLIKPANSCIVLVPLPDKPGRVSADLPVAKRLAVYQTEKCTVTIRSRCGRSMPRKPRVNFLWLNALSDAVTEVRQDFLNSALDVSRVTMMRSALGTNRVDQLSEPDSSASQICWQLFASSSLRFGQLIKSDGVALATNLLPLEVSVDAIPNPPNPLSRTFSQAPVTLACPFLGIFHSRRKS